MDSDKILIEKITAGAEALRVDGKIRHATLNAYLWTIVHSAVRKPEPVGIIFQIAHCCARVYDDMQLKMETK